MDNNKTFAWVQSGFLIFGGILVEEEIYGKRYFFAITVFKDILNLVVNILIFAHFNSNWFQSEFLVLGSILMKEKICASSRNQ